MRSEKFVSHFYNANLSQWAGKDVRIALAASASSSGSSALRVGTSPADGRNVQYPDREQLIKTIKARKPFEIVALSFYHLAISIPFVVTRGYGRLDKWIANEWQYNYVR